MGISIIFILDWDNPGDSNFAGVKVMYRMDGHPMSWY